MTSWKFPNVIFARPFSLNSSMVAKGDRPFDILVYGATGYTGKKVVEYLVEKYPSLPVAISGRTEIKLRKVAEELNLPDSSVLIASLDDDGSGTNSTLVDALRQAKIVLACAGPYRHCGMPLVKAALQAETDYLDLCGEPQFFDDTLFECEIEAREKNILVVSACAFDCVPAELSATLVAKEVCKRFSVCTGIEICHTFEQVGKANVTTFLAAVDGFHAGYNGELKSSRKRVTEKFNVKKAPKTSDGPKLLQPGNLPSFHEDSETYALKFPGADAAAIRASWRYNRIRKPELYDEVPQPKLSVCFGCPSTMDSVKVLSYGAIFSGLARFKFGCNVLKSYPEIFSNGVFTNGGPSKKELEEGSFCTFSKGYGRSENEFVKVTCRGPEPGYVATPRILVSLALTILEHREKLAFSGGVMLPGALFSECDEVYDIMKENSVVFEVQQGPELESNTISTNV